MGAAKRLDGSTSDNSEMQLFPRSSSWRIDIAYDDGDEETTVFPGDGSVVLLPPPSSKIGGCKAATDKASKTDSNPKAGTGKANSKSRKAKAAAVKQVAEEENQ